MARPQCPRCQRPASVCYCHTIQRIDNHWPVHILQHPREAKHAIGTARIAELSLQQCHRYISGDDETATEINKFISEQQPLLIYPGDNSCDISDIRTGSRRPLLFLDGTWRKTHRMLEESPTIAALPRASFNAENGGRYRIRKAPRPGALSTIEAIYRVLSQLEDAPQKYQPLLDSMDWIIDQQIKAMGQSTYQKNYPWG